MAKLCSPRVGEKSGALTKDELESFAAVVVDKLQEKFERLVEESIAKTMTSSFASLEKKIEQGRWNSRVLHPQWQSQDPVEQSHEGHSRVPADSNPQVLAASKTSGMAWTQRHYKSFNLAAIENEEKEKQDEDDAIHGDGPLVEEELIQLRHEPLDWGTQQGPPSGAAPALEHSFGLLWDDAAAGPAESRPAERNSYRGLEMTGGEERDRSKKKTLHLARQYRDTATKVCFNWKKMESVVRSYEFEHLVGLIVMLNAIAIGVETDYMAKGSRLPGWLTIMSNVFCGLFTFELSLRIVLNPIMFFIPPQRWDLFWNLFDIAVVGFQLAECFDGDKDSLSNFGLLRMCRIFRILRLVRVVRFFTELRTLLSSMLASLESLCWALIVLLGIMYTFAVAFCQLVADSSAEGAEKQEAQQWFGTMGASMMTMLEAIAGGVSWRDVIQPLEKNFGTGACLLFVVYVMSCLFALTNAVTGVFVNTMTNVSAQDKATNLAHQLRHLFFDHQKNKRGISPDEFAKHMEDEIMKDFFKNIDVCVSEGQEVYNLLDIDGNGSVDAEELVNGCLRLTGPAKAVDMALVMRQNTVMLEMLQGIQTPQLSDKVAEERWLREGEPFLSPAFPSR